MKSIVGIIGSPRKLGNSEIMAKEIARAVPVPHEFRMVRLSDFNIDPCMGCYRCLFEDEHCILEDDFPALLDIMLEADAVILTAPTYFLGANASLKRFVDRGLAIHAHIEKLWGKPSVGVCIAGIPGMEGHGLLGVQNFLRVLLTDNRANAVIYGALPGEIFMNRGNRNTAKALGMSLIGSAPEPEDAPRCPLCGGDTFRFLDSHTVRCMLCSHSGQVTVESGILSIMVQAGDHPVFLSKTDALRHRDWLKGMKTRFLENKRQLKAIVTDYRKDGIRLKPPTGRRPSR